MDKMKVFIIRQSNSLSNSLTTSKPCASNLEFIEDENICTMRLNILSLRHAQRTPK
ncbi:hypothetical protein [Sporosarcina sp. E16_8]|uniref:hypothetical protein n=1 Tax=Sporosarcina sp. E16_8 TaxID=2789295 RepID=UPI001A9343FA|nr:hypothetical protein [Sporosarcina sp. E16_8]MBO0587482.1 hypothetical protein [Sporosarcina sp. E16_8]